MGEEEKSKRRGKKSKRRIGEKRKKRTR